MIVPTTLSGLPVGSVGIWLLKFGFRTSVKPRFGWYVWIMYGPGAGIGCVDWSDAGVPVGTTCANSRARMYRMSPSGWSSLISIVRFASFVMIPEMWPFFVAA